MGWAGSIVGLLCTPLLLGLSRLGAPPEAGVGLSSTSLGYGVLAYALLAVAPAAVLAWSLKRAGTATEGLSLAALLYGLLAATVFTLVAVGSEGSAGALVASWADQSLGLVIEAWRLRLAEDMSFLEAVADLETRRGWYLRWIVRLAPALALSLMLGMLWVCVVYLRWFVGGERQDDDLTLWTLPMGVMYCFMGCTAMVVLQEGLLAGLVPSSDALLTSALSGLVLLMALYWFQGVAVTNYYFVRMRLGPFSRMAGLGAQALLMIYPVTSVLFGVMGLADAWFDLRRLESDATSETGAET